MISSKSFDDATTSFGTSLVEDLRREIFLFAVDMMDPFLLNVSPFSLLEILLLPVAILNLSTNT